MLAWTVGLLVAAGGAYAVARLAWGYAAPPRRMRFLWRNELAFIEAAGETVFPPGGAIPPSSRDADFPGYLERYLAAADPSMRILMRALFLFMEQAPILFPAPGAGGRRRFSALDAVQRRAYLHAWSESRIFLLYLSFTSLRALLGMAYFAHPPVLRQLGLAPFAIDVPVIPTDLLYPAVGQPASSIRVTAAELTTERERAPLALDGPLATGFEEGP